MTEYINREETINYLISQFGRTFSCSFEDALRIMIEELPAADVQKVKHGKWEHDGHHIRCSVCGVSMCNTDREGDKIPTAYCPECGAKMEVE